MTIRSSRGDPPRSTCSKRKQMRFRQEPDWVVRHVGIDHLHDVVDVNLFDRPVTDADLIELEKLPNLMHVGLVGSHITSAGLVHLVELKQLKYLILERTAVGDDGMVHIAGLS